MFLQVFFRVDLTIKWERNQLAWKLLRTNITFKQNTQFGRENSIVNKENLFIHEQNKMCLLYFNKRTLYRINSYRPMDIDLQFFVLTVFFK